MIILALRIYTPQDINIISRVQSVALNTALPIVLAILKHLHGKDKNGEDKVLTFDSIIKAVKDDDDLRKTKYVISDEALIRSTTEDLIAKKLLTEKEGKIRITKMGNDAVELLLLHLKKEEEKNDE